MQFPKGLSLLKKKTKSMFCGNVSKYLNQDLKCGITVNSSEFSTHISLKPFFKLTECKKKSFADRMTRTIVLEIDEYNSGGGGNTTEH